MSTPYKVYLYIVTFYYAVLSPSFHNRDSETMAWSAVIGSTVHALIAGAFVFYFDWAKDLVGLPVYAGFDDAMMRAGLPVGLWVIIGFFHYPLLQELFDKEDDERIRRAAYTLDPEVVKRRKAEIAELKKLEASDQVDYNWMISKAANRIRRGEPNTSGYSVLGDASWVSRELKRIFP